MPEISTLGWFHTALGIAALASGAYTLYNYREITLERRSGVIYLVATLVTAATALAIYQRGEFGPGHVLAVLTLLALAVGAVADKTAMFGRFSRYLRAIAYTGTLLFHSIPAVTDGLMRLPVGDPVVSEIGDPLLRACYLVLLAAYLIGVTLQLRWIRRQTATAGIL